MPFTEGLRPKIICVLSRKYIENLIFIIFNDVQFKWKSPINSKNYEVCVYTKIIKNLGRLGKVAEKMRVHWLSRLG